MTPQAAQAPSLEDRRRDIVRRYPRLWKRVIAEWSAEDSRDAAWLVYSANYLLRTGATRWAIDPLTLHWRVPEAAAVPVRSDLAALSFIVLTHRHADHLDFDLLRSLRDMPIPWIVPEALRGEIVGLGRLARSRVIVASHDRPMEIDGVRLTSFPGLHYEALCRRASSPSPVASRGVPSSGYLVEWGEKRWLFPGDTRDLQARLLPSFGPVDGLFAHVWLGRSAALDGQSRQLDAQCRFCLDLQSRRVVLTHLEEFGRPATDVWRFQHAALVRRLILNSSREVSVQIAKTGDRIVL